MTKQERNELVEKLISLRDEFRKKGDWETCDLLADACNELDKMPENAEPTTHEEFEWCHDCKEYDQEKYCCHRWSKVIHNTVEELRTDYVPIKHGRWLIGVGENGEPIGTYCSECGWSWERNIAAIQLNKVLSRIKTPRCPNCGAKMFDEDTNVLIKMDEVEDAE